MYQNSRNYYTITYSVLAFYRRARRHHQQQIIDTVSRSFKLSYKEAGHLAQLAVLDECLLCGKELDKLLETPKSADD